MEARPKTKPVKSDPKCTGTMQEKDNKTLGAVVRIFCLQSLYLNPRRSSLYTWSHELYMGDFTLDPRRPSYIHVRAFMLAFSTRLGPARFEHTRET